MTSSRRLPLLAAFSLAAAPAALADQCAITTLTQADAAAAAVDGRQVLEWCEPCGEKAPGAPFAVATADVKHWQDGSPDEYHLMVNGKEEDLAYLFVKGNDGQFHNVSKIAGCPSQDVSEFAVAPGVGGKDVQLPSGVIVHKLTPGRGAQPGPNSTVRVQYEGRLTDGTIFDSSYARHEPAEFPLNAVVRCWQEGLQHARVGGTVELTCPSSTAYGDRGHPPQIPGGATLVFRVELLAIPKP